ncbi:MAG: pyruvate kinase [Deltaproteobacteria bacterium]|nr:pyruvate kinase [Deltaproteobacteria bacterium]
MNSRRKTQIICTMGPASFSPEVIQELGESGMDMCRLNFSHGDHRWFSALVKNIRAVAQKVKKKIPFFVDLKGSKVRLGTFSRAVFLEPGQEYRLTIQEVLGDEKQAQIDSPVFLRELRQGDRVFLSDGKLEMEVVQTESQTVRCRVLNGGWVDSQKGVNCPSMMGNSGVLTKMEESDLLWGIEHKADFFFLSFVRGPEEVERVKAFLRSQGASISLVPKIENQTAVNRIDEIIRVADAICVARGDLGVELPMEELAIAQKLIVAKCRKAGKLVSVGGQMMMTMAENPRPLRAEVCDVANAVLDGAEQLILSDETAIGKYPALTVQIMSRIIERTEEAMRNNWLSRA